MHPHPQLIRAHLDRLHPTQMTVGKIEVALKRKQWAALSKKARIGALADHWFPAVLGPQDQYYIVDHHHFGLALLEEDVKMASLMIVKDASWLDQSTFWNMMDHHQWVHPYDHKGVRRDFDAVPSQLDQLKDDPYRSLAGAVRRAGGFAKDVAPFSEFLWADFFRNLIPARLIKQDFTQALIHAQKMADSQAARYLPGWCGLIAVA